MLYINMSYKTEKEREREKNNDDEIKIYTIF